MSKNRETRIITRIVSGEGPNGEDVKQFVDVVSGDVVKEEVLKEEEKQYRSAVDQRAEQTGGSSNTKRPLSAVEMMNLAIKEREQTIGARVNDLITDIMAGCRAVILEGSYEHSIDISSNVSSEVIKKVVSDLKSLGYKVKIHANPHEDYVSTITIKWPVKEDKSTSSSAVQPVSEAPKKEKKVKAKEIKELVGKVEADFNWPGAKSMPGGRPARRFPKPSKSEDVS